MRVGAPAVPSVGWLPTGIRLEGQLATAGVNAGGVLGPSRCWSFALAVVPQKVKCLTLGRGAAAQPYNQARAKSCQAGRRRKRHVDGRIRRRRGPVSGDDPVDDRKRHRVQRGQRLD